MNEKNGYSRVLLKLSGEQLAGTKGFGIDTDFISWLAEEVRKIVKTGVEIAIVIGGGNLIRGGKISSGEIKRVTADQMGMLGGLMNSMAVTDVFEAHDIKTRCLTNVRADQIAELYSNRRAEKHLEQKRVVLVAGGLGRPYFTHDTAAVNIALELGCGVVLKATKVNGVFTKDPATNEDAEYLPIINYQDAVENPDIQVMDKAALGLAMEHAMPVIVFDLLKEDNLVKAIRGEQVGSRIGN